MDVIEVSNDTETYSFEMEGTNLISLATIDNYFSGAKGLSYKRNDIQCQTKVLKNNMLQLSPNVHKYSVFYGKTNNPKRKFDNKILDIIEKNMAKQLKKQKFVEVIKNYKY